MSGPFVCPCCGSKDLGMGYYDDYDDLFFLTCASCGNTENFCLNVRNFPCPSPRTAVFAGAMFND